jgi:uncharacterized protein YegP (UPF0339 family)
MKFKVRKSANGQYYFTTNASNGQVLATSEMYRAKADCIAAIRLIQAGAAGAGIDDLT